MKIHARNTGAQRQRRSAKNNAQGHPLAFSLLLIMIIILGTFYIFNLTVDYSSQTEQLSARISDTNAQIAQFESEIAYLEMEKEAMMEHKHIYKKIAEFKLGLRPADPQQERSLNNPTANARYARRRTVSNSSVALLR